MFILDFGISGFKTLLEPLNNLGQNPKVNVITLLSRLFLQIATQLLKKK